MLKRYLLLIEKINNSWHPSFEELNDFLQDHGFNVSARTIQRDLETIRNDYAIEIEYYHDKRGYAINREKSLNVNAFLRFMGLVRTANVLIESLQSSRENMNYLDFDSVHLFSGTDHIKPLLHAIQNRRLIGFSHQKFHSTKPSHLILKPYFLREYQYRWYLVGIPEGEKEPKNYGLDRILKVDVLPETFERTNENYVRNKYKHTIGVTFSAGKEEKILLRCTRLTGKYLESLPLHASQTITDKGEEHWLIKLKVVPNFEFEQKLLMHFYQLEVLSPGWLREKIIGRIRETLSSYEK